MANINLPNEGDFPWDLNPAITAINSDVETLKTLTADGRLSEDHISSEIVGVVNTVAIPSTQKGAVNGVAALDSSGDVPYGQLPSALSPDNLADNIGDTVEALVGSPITKADIGLGNVDNTSDLNKPVSAATQALIDTRAAALTSPPAGRFLIPTSTGTLGGGNVRTLNELRVHPVWLPVTVKVDQLGVDVTTAGESGSVIRIGVFSDAGLYPGGLVSDAGTIDGTTTGVKFLTLSSVLTLTPGIYWVGSVAQGFTTTGPAIRLADAGWSPPFPVSDFATPTATTTGYRGFSRTGISGGLPSSFGNTNSAVASVHRHIFRTAS